MTPLFFDEQTLSEARRFNKKLAWMPRFKIRNRFTPLLLQSMLHIAQLGGDRKLQRQGLSVERRIIAADKHRVPVRIIRPAGAVKGLVCDIHGGGWVIGNAQMDDDQNAAMAIACNVAVVSVDYRLFGSATMQQLMDDVLAATCWLLNDGLPGYRDLPVIVVGESAGGHLAAATLLRLKAWPDLLARIKGAVLFYGVYDMTGTASVREAGADTLLLDGLGMVPAFRMLTPGLDDAARREAPLSPLHGELAGLPPAWLVAGTLDPLRDDTMAMAEKWSAVAAVEAHLVPDAPHGFIHFPTRMADQVLARSRAWISERLEENAARSMENASVNAA